MKTFTAQTTNYKKSNTLKVLSLALALTAFIAMDLSAQTLLEYHAPTGPNAKLLRNQADTHADEGLTRMAIFNQYFDEENETLRFDMFYNMPADGNLEIVIDTYPQGIVWTDISFRQKGQSHWEVELPGVYSVRIVSTETPSGHQETNYIGFK